MPYETMQNILLRAFGITRNQLFAPEWVGSAHYAIEAKMPEGAAPRDVPGMLRSMLSEWFGMRYHSATRETPAWALKVAKPGLKAKRAEAQVPARMRALRDPVRTGGLRFEMAQTPAGLADFLREQMQLPVVDQTGLSGIYLFAFDYYFFGGFWLADSFDAAERD
jgi:uncharacterized protein (TIGR03435 family)